MVNKRIFILTRLLLQFRHMHQ